MPPARPDRRPPGACHDNALPQWAVEKMAHRRGRRFAFEAIDPARTALLVIDLTRNYEDMPCTASIVAPVQRLAAGMRAVGGTVVWVFPAPMAPDDPLLTALWGPETVRRHAGETRAGGGGTEPISGLTRDPADLTVHKRGYSAFFPGASPLHDRLAQRGIDTVIVTGVLTNVCCESSARDAFALGYRVIVAADANAARSDAEHRAALYNILRNFGDVRMTDDLLQLLAEHAA